MSRIFSIVGQLRYPTTNDRNADRVNAALAAIGAPALGNDRSVWSCSRYDTNNVWFAHGYYGFAFGYTLSYSAQSVPLVLLDVA